MSDTDSIARARVVILSGSNNNFSTGMDLGVFEDIAKIDVLQPCDGRKREGLMKVIQFFQDCISSPEFCRVPVIAAVDGYCIGAGVDLISACDLRYCTASAKFCIKETDLAMVADLGTLQRIPNIIGDQRTRELTYTARIFSGKEAEEYGLVLKCFDTKEEMVTHVNNLAETIAAKSPLTIRGIKKTCIYARDNKVVDALEQIKYHNSATLMSADLTTAMIGIATNKTPVYKD